MGRNDVLLQECLALAVSKAEEYNIHLVKGHLVGKAQIGIANKAFVHIADQIAGI